MKITNGNIEKALQVYRKQSSNDKKVSAAKKASKRDELNISNQGKDFQVAMKALKNTPDIRKEKVAEIKRQISTGTYNIDSGKIVEKILEDINIDMKI
ncbi:flagellar biosynthesis anti-sigma factor FlgM [Caldisalinibacter kiritimatiensis]|uniref:Negative regulator of flagellin synthesis n=1 Tax=Caldisalinibacter kiritimatiensis TaxID=1304284 RepID=R1ARW2_9FIRM|nr:flagellar biosynthesis anti-sigma factor FlgM [Caldisalinibacter kiritimatiensis]EOC99396.1 anti-sigma-28 factor, FlgM [Caldisalinibacter kiritimatiensis]